MACPTAAAERPVVRGVVGNMRVRPVLMGLWATLTKVLAVVDAGVTLVTVTVTVQRSAVGRVERYAECVATSLGEPNAVRVKTTFVEDTLPDVVAVDAVVTITTAKFVAAIAVWCFSECLAHVAPAGPTSVVGLEVVYQVFLAKRRWSIVAWCGCMVAKPACFQRAP